MSQPGQEREHQDRQVRRRMLAFVVVFGAALLAVLLRLVDLQLLRHDVLSGKAERQHLQALRLKPNRGRILDRQGRALALSIPAASVYAHTAVLGDGSEVAALLGKALDLAPAAVSEKLRVERSFVWIKRQVTPEEAARVRALNLPGIGMLEESRRFYPKRSLAGQVLGFVGIDGRGLEGIELRFDEYLRGRERTITVSRDATGRKLRLRDEDAADEGPGRGSDVVVTLDEAIQTFAEEALHEQVERTKARGGTVIVLDPGSGALLAMAQEPPFNPNTYKEAQASDWRNRAITDSYEPGSTFKVIGASTALHLGRVRLTELFFGEQGSYAVGGIVIHDQTPSSWLTFPQVIQKSSNIGTVKITQRLTPRQLYEAMRRFGFGAPTGVDLPGEVGGLLHPLAGWSSSSIGALAIGQEIGVTPLQLAVAYAAIANGGEVVQPHVLYEVRNGNDVVVATPRRAARRVLSPEASAQMRQVLEGAVTEGTGTAAAVPGYRIAGKTGTAQKADPALGTYAPGKYVASFVGFAPAESPRIVVLALLDEPRGTHYGGKIAAPVFRRLVEATLYYLRVPSSLSRRATVPEPVARRERRDGRGSGLAGPARRSTSAARQLVSSTLGSLFGEAFGEAAAKAADGASSTAPAGR
ncbi:MAG: penicillin-binding protein 2 [Candidatus Tectomicrobia bacterium]|nr:penicillin-binding protein 2 [Candidatus Tectomicrobia bacterium]